jgi:glucose-1-phosphate cytidylyltransferase
MKVVILAGGFGTRLSEETDLKPKPMVEIGSEPILWHIMKIYSYYGFNDFIICLGYKGYIIKEYFANYYLHNTDVTLDLQNNNIITHGNRSEPWKVTLIDTGINTMTGGRLKRVKEYIGKETFMMTYGDGLADIDIIKLLEFHQLNHCFATLTAVQPKGRFGAITINNMNKIISFREKPEGDGGWINGGFFVLEPEVFDYIEDNGTVFEKEPLESLSKEMQLAAYLHNGFWKCMDTMSDKNVLENLLKSGRAPWVKWQ